MTSVGDPVYVSHVLPFQTPFWALKQKALTSLHKKVTMRVSAVHRGQMSSICNDALI
jgi:hypothetical protein